MAAIVCDTLRSVSPAGNRCHFVPLDKDGSYPQLTCLTLGRSNGPAYSTGELLNTPQMYKSLISIAPSYIADILQPAATLHRLDKATPLHSIAL